MPQPKGFAVIDVATGKPLAKGQWRDRAESDDVRISGDGSRVAVTTRVGIETGPVRVFDAATGAPLGELRPGTFDCALDPHGRWLLCSPSSDPPEAVAELWDVATGVKLQDFPKSDHGEGTAAHFSPDGKLIAVPARSPTSGASMTDLWRLRDDERVKPGQGKPVTPGQ